MRIAALLLSLSVVGLRAHSIPICNQCRCLTSRDGTEVDCSELQVPFETMSNFDNWKDPSGKLYSISKALFRDSDIPDLVKKFPALNVTVLDFSENFIQQIDDEYFSDLQNLRELVLSHNNIVHLKPDAFKGPRMDGRDNPLRSLIVLKLDHNKMHTLDANLFRHVEDTLEVLDLSFNPFKVIDQHTQIAINSIVGLKELYLSYSGLTQLPQYFLHTPGKLKVLDLSGNRFTEVPKNLNDSHVLEVLHFNNNPIVNLTEDNGFPTVSTLKTLYLCEMNQLETIEAHSLSKLVNLEELHICNNIRLRSIDPAALTWTEVESEIWPPIRKLDLHDNQLTGLDLHLVLHWDHLETLDLSYNPWSCDCENDWMVNILMPIYLKINRSQAEQLSCEAPTEMAGKTFYEEYVGNKTMRCADFYGNRPEKDAMILVGVLIGLLVGVPVILFFIFAYQRHWFGVFDSSPAAFSRQFYSRTRGDEL